MMQPSGTRLRRVDRVEAERVHNPNGLRGV